MCFKFLTPSPARTKPTIETRTLQGVIVFEELKEYKLNWMFPGCLDLDYYYTTAADWAKVLDWCYFKGGMPKYIVDKMDCDDFAIFVKGLISAEFGLNYVAILFGQSPAGYHAFNGLRTPEGMLLLEPQTGAMAEFGSWGYVPEWILL
jgi:hypothetical protein